MEIREDGHKIPLDPAGRADNPEMDSMRDDGTHEVARDLAYKRLAIVNVVYYGSPDAGDRMWALIDAGLPKTAGKIIDAAEERFGAGSPPGAIIMTHGHFDHVGALEELARHWDVPIYCHDLELPYLSGASSYLPPDPSVGGGMMAMMSPLFPRGPVDVSEWLTPLPEDGTVPGMPGWTWIHTPGHTPGHISLWRESDRILISGDAVITTNQESAYAALTQETALHGPPMYFTPDWTSARASVGRMAALEPEILLPMHGRAMKGAEMRASLHLLADEFDRIAVPEHGRYVL